MRVRTWERGCLLICCFAGLCSWLVVYRLLGETSIGLYKWHHMCLVALSGRWGANKSEQVWRDVYWHQFCVRLAETTLLIFVYTCWRCWCSLPGSWFGSCLAEIDCGERLLACCGSKTRIFYYSCLAFGYKLSNPMGVVCVTIDTMHELAK